MIVQFDYYMHDEYSSDERVGQIAESAGIDISEELGELIGRPFYKVVLHCSLDTDTGAVEILGVDP